MTIVKMNARDLIIDLLLGLQGNAISIKQIIIAARLFEISENSIRVAVTRLSSDGVIEALERGIYQFTLQSHEWANVMLNRKHGLKQTKVWNQQYLAVFTGELGRVDRTALNRRERALKHLGFKELEQGIFIRPDNLAISFDQLELELKTSGLESSAKICQISHFDAKTLALIPALWSVQTLNQNYQKYNQMIQNWLATVHQLSLEDAARESLLLGRQTISLLMNDPLLPKDFVDVELREQFAESVRQLDQTGLASWRKFYEGQIE
ncbi:PaaX family transcriptional regulator C-terminal domain-containing protein [Acinetobacter proteolyticus]|jgi:phenylacetic acid degradation operon negative regulatory protein|uniref:PaaX family transcriptional regulator n=2 Tax=Acinetobacter proteolyticus TaxID=1776741 RepID=A0A2N0WCT2_9GAMM|nr:PaaX family transcriptional regulator C-terminal domain-containing protein [Acinetobacter proteolyticus]PKF32317.1 PaaX family transcriptional regulator [Acinetobacter proteolyticus]WEI18302.1 PaaX family transcriptional regulator C-terminal domain-containing protein [Acinetobacter proteolyticus]